MKNLLFSGLVLASLTPLTQADTWVVDRAGGGDFVAIQPAIDAAQDGDVILVRSGAYQNANIRILGKGVSIFGEPDVTFVGSVRVEDVPAGSSAVVSNLPVTSVIVEENQGRVQLQRLDGTWVYVLNSDAVVIAKSRFQFQYALEWDCYEATPALRITHSNVWAYASEFTGQEGGYVHSFTYFCVGPGGPAVDVVSGEFRASHCTLIGGPGGWAAGVTGDGGDGLRNNGLATLRQTGLSGGAGSWPGVAWSGNAPVMLAGVGRGIAIPHMTAPDATLDLLLLGEPGEEAYLLLSSAPATQVLLDPEAGTLHASLSDLGPKHWLGPVPASQIVAGSLTAPKVDVGEAGVFFAQALFVNAQREIRLGEARAIVVIDPAVGF